MYFLLTLLFCSVVQIALAAEDGGAVEGVAVGGVVWSRVKKAESSADITGRQPSVSVLVLGSTYAV